MRLRRLELDLFGGFTGRRLEFGPRRDVGASDFHVIYGPNEAGKTTTMEAYLRLLYGFPHREPYDFLHQRKNLRVSGVLDVDGVETPFVRLPTREPSLRDLHGAELPGAALNAHLGGLSEDDYRHLFCLDDETIEKGGEEITRAKGDIGRLLFSAAAGISELSEVLDQVRAEADGLYRKRASSTRMAVLKKEHAEVDRRISALDVPAAQYRKLKKLVGEARDSEAEVMARRTALFASRAEIEGKLKALPLLGEIDALSATLDPFSAWPTTLDIDPEGLVRMLTDQAKATSSVERLEQEIADLRSEMSGIVEHPVHIAVAQDLDDLADLRIKYASAEFDLERRKTMLADAREQVRLAASDMGAPADGDPVAVVLSTETIARLEQCRERMRETCSALGRARDDLATLEAEIEVASAVLTRVSQDKGAMPDLDEVFERFAVDALVARHAAAAEAVHGAQRHARAALDALAHKGQNFDALPLCQMTVQEAEALLRDVQKVIHQREGATRELAELRTDLAARRARIAQIKAIEGLVADDEAQALRVKRDSLWRAHKDSLTGESAARFEAAMMRVDAAADRRLSQVADIGTLRQQEQDAAELQVRVDHASQQVAALGEAQEAMSEQFASAARTAGLVAPLAPEAWVAWLRKREFAAQAEAELHRLRGEHSEVFARAQRLMDVLSQHIVRDMPEFEDLVAAAKKQLAAQRASREELRAARLRVDDLTQDRGKRTQRLAALEQEATAARADWVEQVAAALPARLNIDLLEGSLQPLHDLRERENERSALERQVSGMENDQRQFADKVSQLAGRIGFAATGAPLSDYDALRALSQEATEARDKARDLSARVAVLEQARDDSTTVLAEIETSVAELARLFPEGVEAGSLDDLRQCVIRAADVIEGRARRAALEREVLSLLDLERVEDARAALAGESQARLRAALDEASADLDSVEALYKSAIEARSRAEGDLRAIGGDDDIARLVERKATLELELQDAAVRHLELSLGHRLAEAAIRRYRDAHRNAMMQATETAFAELTNGAYCTLQTRTDGASETLLALDASGMAKQAQDMSKGTRFQLYLALRAAAYEQLAQQGTSLPFFCDDIFETFDEGRTRSACRVMERIGRRGQAIYLTHHQHVVDIAREVCGDGVQIHALDG